MLLMPTYSLITAAPPPPSTDILPVLAPSGLLSSALNTEPYHAKAIKPEPGGVHNPTRGFKDITPNDDLLGSLLNGIYKIYRGRHSTPMQKTIENEMTNAAETVNL